jgi:DNA-binding transcriptional ArsR family regulator
MPRAATTADVFNAIAEPRRRLIIEALAGLAERAGADDHSDGAAVQALVDILRLPQPTVSKHLAVLLAVGVVVVKRRGRQRLYRLNAARLKPVHQWTGKFERFWSEHLSRIRHRAESRARARAAGASAAGTHPLLAIAQRNKQQEQASS